ncbi:hypothetical protein J7T55_009118 [Diaporthe amygdali]|uniref:uncharacterized protein n=1 Tax=Phomopsis amygdali TaxID=1214568 RepID=UPI0022FECE40|nr:uncharacterized protein J7T55_009118 [Diaporthe amygdali]KAJ0118335.1 hypothetical protein J7T55_009118 [Diaporthe amygdali]
MQEMRGAVSRVAWLPLSDQWADDGMAGTPSVHYLFMQLRVSALSPVDYQEPVGFSASDGSANWDKKITTA